MLRGAAFAAFLALPPSAMAQDAASWLVEGVQMPVSLAEAGTWHPVGGEVFVTDPLTLWQTMGDTITVPDVPARLIGLIELEQGRTAAIALIWADTPVACGEDLGTVAVDTGLAGILKPADVAALDAFALDGIGVYHGSFAEQLDARIPTPPFLATLPGGATFPVSGTGWGDGGYPVASLHDREGDMVALYVQFMGGVEEWALPRPCASLTS